MAELYRRRMTESPNPSINKENLCRTMQALNVMRKNGELCDVVLIAGASSPDERAEADLQISEERVEIPAHRSVLAASCPYFHAMFTAEMAESKQREIFIQEINPRALVALVEFLYTSEISITEENVQILLPAANFLRICDVSSSCCLFLKKHLDPSNCLGIQAFADLHACGDLHATTNTFIEQNFSEIVQCDEFLSLTRAQLQKLISNDRITVANEETVFESVMQWVRYDPDQRKEYLPLLMEYIRLPLLSQEYLLEKVDSDPLVRANPVCKDYLIEALKYHLMKDDQKRTFTSPRARPRMPLGLPELMMVIGGQAPKAIRNVDMYDFQLGRWIVGADLPVRRCRCGVALLNGLVYAVGGFNGQLRVRTVDVYDPKKDIWVAAPSMEARRSTLGVGVLDGSIFAVGGFDGATGLNSAEAFDPRSGEWRMLSSMATRRSSVGVAVLSGFVYAIGGYDGLSRQCLSTVEVYDPRNDCWRYSSDMTTRRSGPGVGVLHGKLYTLGGHDGPNLKKSTEVFHTDSNEWRETAEMTCCRRNAGVCAVGDNLYSVGGDDGASNLTSVEIYCPKDNQWTLMPNSMPIGRSYAGVCVINKHVL